MKPAIVNYQTAALCLRIEATDGTRVRLTRYPRDLVMSKGEVYRTGSGYDFSGYTADTSFSAGIVDLEGILGLVGLGRDQIAAGLFDNARATLFATDFYSPVEDEEIQVVSILGKATLKDGRYVFEDMALIDLLGQSVGDTFTATCRKAFGGQEFGGCHVNLVPLTVTGTLTAVTDSRQFRDSARTEVADWFGLGTIAFTTGANAGLPAIQVKHYQSDGRIELYEPTYYPPAVGDAYTLIPGCRRRHLEDCVAKYGNGPRFGGFPWVPMSSTYRAVGGS